MLNHGIQQIGNYRIIRLLGQGGFGAVYLGEHIHLGTEAAIKVLRTSNQLPEQVVEKFREEAQIITKLEHAHIIKVRDFGIVDDLPFLIMDFAPGGTLRERYPSGTILPSANIITYIKQVSNALQYAHSKKLIHRDVKPENMLIANNDDILLSDFGLAVTAHSTESQVTQNPAGTWAYTAPEQIQGNPRPASDQYSLGTVVYEWICGCRPFDGSPEALVMQHLNSPPPPLHDKIPSIYPAIEDVVLKTLAKNPQERFETIETFSKALEEAFMEQEAVVPSASASTQLEIQSSVSSPQEADAPAPPIGTLLCTYQSSYYIWLANRPNQGL